MDVTAWNKLAENCNQYLRKGRQVLVIGKIDASAYTAQDGTLKASLELTARDVRVLGSKGEDAGSVRQGNGPSVRQPAKGQDVSPFEDDEEIPF